MDLIKVEHWRCLDCGLNWTADEGWEPPSSGLCEDHPGHTTPPEG